MTPKQLILIIDGTRVDDVRVYEGPVQTLKERMGTDGNNQSVTENIYRALRIGIGNEGDPSYTLDQTGAQSVAIPIQGTIIGRQDHNGPQGKGFGDETDPMYTLDSVSQYGVATDMQVRRLTPTECERLMGWPDNHTLPRTDGK